MRIEILESAMQDLIAGRDFYESQEEGLGEYFLNSLFADVDSLRLFAGVHPIFFDRYHRLLSKRFPFAVYYTVTGDIARVYAVLDCRRDPGRIEQQIRSLP